MELEVSQGDITQENVDAIVNAAHEGMCGGGGVDGAIHRAAGSQMTGECLNIPLDKNGERCPVGQAKITGGYKLQAQYIIHTVGPVWRGGTKNEENDLRSCYTNCLQLANTYGLKSISFPCISTGAFCFPKDKAAAIAVSAVKDFSVAFPNSSIETVRFVCFESNDVECYLLQKIEPAISEIDS
jgi:O-acetyl-ADP-ribose deacetylase (regulator of RNase III)